MKKLSLVLLSDTVISRRKALKITQVELANRTGMNRSMLSKLESQEYTPSIPQLQALGEALGFEPIDLFIDDSFENCQTIVEKTDATVYMMNTRMNENLNPNHVKRVYSWCEIEDLIG